MSFVVKCLDKIFSDLLLINFMLLLTAPSDRVFDMIHNLDRSVGFIALGLLASMLETAESIY